MNEIFDPIEDLRINVISDALTTENYGVYPIYVTAGNTNYEVEQNDANYTLTGYFKITYILPNGEIYEENVQEGKIAMGVTKNIYNIGFFEDFVYSKDIKKLTDDTTVRVSVNDYKIYAIGGFIFVVFIVIYFALTKVGKKKRYA